MEKQEQTIIEINGAMGEGGGQVFRSSLTLAMCLGTPVKIKNIRAGRKKPGLLRQHLTCLRAAEEISQGRSTGGELGSSEVEFYPGEIRSGEYRFAIGSAGSTTLVFQTVFLPLSLAGGISELYFEGGTHNGMAPSFDFIKYSFIPLIEKIGCKMNLELERYGFYPAGGGAWRARVYPTSNLKRLKLNTLGKPLRSFAVATSAKLPKHVTERELKTIGKQCEWYGEDLEQRLVDSVGPGNIVSLHLGYELSTEIIEIVGETKVSAEKLAQNALIEMEKYLQSGAAVGEHLADQLILPMVLGQGGSFTTVKPSMHLLTNIELAKQFVDVEINLKEIEQNKFQINIEKKVYI